MAPQQEEYGREGRGLLLRVSGGVAERGDGTAQRIQAQVVPQRGLARAFRRAQHDPILVSCGLGGQALIGGALLVDYGFTNVKVVDGGNNAWVGAGEAVCPCANWSWAASWRVSVTWVASRWRPIDRRDDM